MLSVMQQGEGWWHHRVVALPLCTYASRQHERRAGWGKSSGSLCCWEERGSLSCSFLLQLTAHPSALLFLSPLLSCCCRRSPPPLPFFLSCTSTAKPIRVLSGGRAKQNHHSSEELLHLPRANRELAAQREETQSNPASVCVCVSVC